MFGVSSRENLPEISPVKEEDFLAEAEAEAGVTIEREGDEEVPVDV